MDLISNSTRKTKFCVYCGQEINKNYTKEHLIPKSLGGKGDKNLTFCCNECNQERGNKTYKEWVEEILLNKKNRSGFEIEVFITNIKYASDHIRKNIDNILEIRQKCNHTCEKCKTKEKSKSMFAMYILDNLIN